MTLTPGQTYYEGPDDLHIVGRNASSTKPAKFIVLLVKDTGVAPFLPPEQALLGVERQSLEVIPPRR